MPDEPLGAFTVICGRNNSGKTHLLRRLREAVSPEGSRAATGRLINVTLTRPPPPYPSVFFTDRFARDKAKAGTVASASRGTPSDVPDFKESAQRLAFKFFAPYLQAPLPTIDEWSKHEIRLSVFNGLPERTKDLYLCSPDDTDVKTLEEALGGRLYMRVNSRAQLDFCLLQGERDILVFDNWSEGQKLAFALLSIILDRRPSIVLIDELETHLHPGLMSSLLGWMKRYTRQIIATTHHPHLIFSHYADEVVFLDLTRNRVRGEVPARTDFAKHDYPESPVWEARSLDDDYARIASAYHLFDYQDNRLLRHAALIAAASDVEFFRAVASSFEDEVRPAATKPLPDGQTLQVVDVIRRCRPQNGPVRCLDLGCGLGRVAVELSKVRALRPESSGLEWVCWDPDPSKRATARSIFEALKVPASVADSLAEVPDQSVHLCVVANVLHELTPTQAAALLADARSKLDPSLGTLVILELYPLLRAEKLAVPYPADTLIAVLNSIGYDAFSRSFRVMSASGGSAHCVIGAVRNDVVPVGAADIQAVLEAHWDLLLSKAVSSYRGLRRVESYEDFLSVLQDLTTIASITTYRSGRWTT
ncbi:MAG: AAA family ATPase [Polyangiales bacterium]